MDGSQLLIHQCLPEESTSRLEITQVIVHTYITVRVDFHTHLVDGTVQKKPKIGVEKRFRHYLVELTCDTSSIQARLTNKFKPKIECVSWIIRDRFSVRCMVNLSKAYMRVGRICSET